MNHDEKTQINQCFEQLAREEGISLEAIRNNIGLVISYALKSNNPQVQNFWKSIPCKENTPTIEEIIDYIAFQLSEEKK